MSKVLEVSSSRLEKEVIETGWKVKECDRLIYSEDNLALEHDSRAVEPYKDNIYFSHCWWHDAGQC